jgi:linoleoyl-CoA desaturase
MDAPTTAKVRFDPKGTGFHAEVKKRVDAWFEQTGTSRHADARMVAKSAFWLTAQFTLYGLVLANALPPLGMLAAALGMGFCFACLGFNIGHDAIHGAYSEKPWINRVMGWTFQGVGAASYTWSVAHNLVHHTWTNIPGHDGDIEPGAVMRFHTAHPLRAPYRFQHLYAWFLYCMTTLVWVFKKDLAQVYSLDPRSGKPHTRWAKATVVFSKVSHAVLFIALPLLLIDLPLWQLAIGYLAMHAVAGFSLAVVFQLAHVVEGPAMPDAETVAFESWADHQMRTTANFGRGSFWCQFICGGLNYQVEHHLFPRICHVHYPSIAKIVEDCAKEHGLPYHEAPTFWGAVASHYRLLRTLGTAPQRSPAVAPTSLRIAA